jgi:ribosomal protein L37AE/L43A
MNDAQNAQSNALTTSTDVTECPGCGNQFVVRYTINQRGCNDCGLTWTVVTAEDEADAKERERPREQVIEGEGAGARNIGRFQQRW